MDGGSLRPDLAAEQWLRVWRSGGIPRVTVMGVSLTSAESAAGRAGSEEIEAMGVDVESGVAGGSLEGLVERAFGPGVQ